MSESTYAEMFEEYFVGGTLRIGGTWGGPHCLNHIPSDMRLKEASTWILGTLACLVCLRAKKSHDLFVQKLRSIPISRTTTLDYIFASVNFILWLFVLYTKIRIQSLCNMFQPCAVMLLVNTFAVLSKGVLGPCLTVYLLPFAFGAWGALAVIT